MSHIAMGMRPTIEVRVLYLGGSRVQAQTEQQTLCLPDTATLGDAVAHIARTHPDLAPLLPLARWARNMAFAASDEPLAHGDELALIPPVCGGRGRSSLQTTPIDVHEVIQRVQSSHHGASAIFLGTVRNHNAGRAVHEMVYEAYRPMADQELERVAEACCQNGAEISIVHRMGRMSVGDVTVAIAASHVHRDEAFVACRQAIEAIKHQVPIWKKEMTPTGEVWVGWGP